MDEQYPNLFETIRDVKKRAFLEVYSKCGTVRGAIRATGISSSTPYYWRKHDPTFVEAMELAAELACDLLRDEAVRRAVDGIPHLKFDGKGLPLIDPQTGEIYIERSYSDRLLIFLLSQHFARKRQPGQTQQPAGGGVVEPTGAGWYESETDGKPQPK